MRLQEEGRCRTKRIAQNETEEYSAIVRPSTVRRRLFLGALRWGERDVRGREEGDSPLGANRHCSRGTGVVGDGSHLSDTREGHVSVPGAAGAARFWSDPACKRQGLFFRGGTRCELCGRSRRRRRGQDGGRG